MTEEYVCDYCGEENDESCPLVENINGNIVCESCIGNGRDQTLVSFDFTLDSIISVKAPKGTDPDTLHDQLREKLRELLDDNCEAFMFEGIFEEDQTND